MENNEIMFNEEYEVMDDHIVADDGAGIGTGVAMLIGAGLAFAVGGAVKAGKWAITKFKEKKALNQPDKDISVEDSEVADVAAK